MKTTAQPPTTDTWPEGVLYRFQTVGGATVDLHAHRFATQYTNQGRPFASNEWREVDGYMWLCRGCDTSSFDDFTYHGGYLPGEKREARDHAQAHAERCRAMPRPEQAAST